MLNQPSAAELNAVIAKWMGWEESMISGWIAPAEQGKHWRIWKKAPPDYAGDLNAWGDAWLAIERCGYEDHFGVELMKVQLNEPPCRTGYYECAKATARQRAEALGRVIGGEDR